jgi:flagellar basal-body rod protein FlgB
MWIDRLLQDRHREALEFTARFAEQRHQLLAENVANVDTPDYVSRRLDAGAFQHALRDAFQRAERVESIDGMERAALPLRSDDQLLVGRDGVRFRPRTEPAENLLFHDGTNARLESLLSQTAENQLLYSFAITRLKGKLDTLMTAIRGRTGG